MVALPGGDAGLDSGVRFTPIPVSGESGSPETLRWNPRAIRRLLSDFHPALVQIEEPPGSPAGMATAAAARRSKIPYVLFSWESLSRKRGFLENRRYRSTLAHAAGVIGGNRLARDLLAREAPGAHAAVLPQTGLSPAAVLPRAVSGTGLRIAFVGRLVPERGAEMLLRACAPLLGAWTLTVVGTGPEQEPLEALAERLGLASRIRWAGGIPLADLGGHWGAFDCLVVPSQQTPAWVERSSPMLLQAMAHGVAPIVSSTGALPELVGNAGIVVPDTEALALALQELLAEPARAHALGQRARQRVLEEFVDAAVAQRTLAFWEVVLAAGQYSSGSATRRPSRAER
jgi:glycosyltransferase involved in cell wall biosynthesis